jgi:1-pyrroline-4-hydroxy-2-carboxylate deaminase
VTDPGPTAPIGRGMLVAITTPFVADGSIDLPAFATHVRWLVERGVDGIVVAGSLGEGSALSAEERVTLVTETARAVPPGTRVVAAIGAARTHDAVAMARAAAHAGANGLLVLPPYVYHPDAREARAHFSAVFDATSLPAMLYNNPAAYGTDTTAADVLALAEDHANLVAVKESSGDVRRITAIRTLLGERVDIAVGLDDVIVEGVAAGATGWVAGLANALPRESLTLLRAAQAHAPETGALYDWFLPLLRMDTTVKFVQQIKMVEAELGVSSTRVRAPRQELAGDERESTLSVIRERLGRRPTPGGPGLSALDRRR